MVELSLHPRKVPLDSFVLIAGQRRAAGHHDRRKGGRDAVGFKFDGALVLTLCVGAVCFALCGEAVGQNGTLSSSAGCSSPVVSPGMSLCFAAHSLAALGRLAIVSASFSFSFSITLEQEPPLPPVKFAAA